MKRFVVFLLVALGGVTASAQQLNLRAMLQGAVTNGTVVAEVVLPEAYAAQAPSDAIDRVTVELKAAGHDAVTVSAWLLRDGRIVDDNANNLTLPVGLPLEPHTLVLRHRNHLPLQAARTIQPNAEDAVSIDLTQRRELAENVAVVETAVGLAAPAGNLFDELKSPPSINATDYFMVRAATSSGDLAADVNFDGTVDMADVSLVRENNNRLYTTVLQLP